MAGQSLNLVWTKRTRLGQDILENDKGRKSWCACHVFCVCGVRVCVYTVYCVSICGVCA